MGKVSVAWKNLERAAAKKLGGTRLVRGNNFSESMLDVEHPWLAIDAKWRSTLATVKWYKKLVKDSNKIYGKGNKIPILVIKEKGMVSELVVIDISDFIEAVNNPDYVIIPKEIDNE